MFWLAAIVSRPRSTLFPSFNVLYDQWRRVDSNGSSFFYSFPLPLPLEGPSSRRGGRISKFCEIPNVKNSTSSSRFPLDPRFIPPRIGRGIISRRYFFLLLLFISVTSFLHFQKKGWGNFISPIDLTENSIVTLLLRVSGANNSSRFEPILPLTRISVNPSAYCAPRWFERCSGSRSTTLRSNPSYQPHSSLPILTGTSRSARENRGTLSRSVIDAVL